MTGITLAPLPNGLTQPAPRSPQDGQAGTPDVTGFGQLLTAMLADRDNAASAGLPEPGPAPLPQPHSPARLEAAAVEEAAPAGPVSELRLAPARIPSTGAAPGEAAPAPPPPASPMPFPPAGREENRAPDFAPRIGSHSGEFERARLLVETAFDRKAPAGPATPDDHAPVPLSVPSAEQTGEAAMRRGGPPGPADIPALPGPGEPAAHAPAFATTIPSRTPQPHATPPLSANPVPRGQTSALPAPAPSRREPLAPAAASLPQSEPAPPGEALTKAPSTPREGAPGRNLPFAAHLFAIDGGVRLLLRLPRLTEGERSELEAGLTRLLEGFGHRRHEIVIHETAKG